MPNPAFSPTKFFAGRGAVHEAVVIYCKCTAPKQLRKNLWARRVNFLISNEKHPVIEEVHFY